MLQMILPEGSSSLLAFFGIIFVFGATVLATAKLSPYLPKDAGREFAHDGKLSAGKPRGAGIIFVMAFVASVLLFSPLSAELVIYLLLIVMIERVPESPSTPSEQLVTFTEVHTRITVRMANTTGGRVNFT
jgi:UDP-N-acetylmuramyl pentapeptide phosphotransferase/UDP-N-acetylglucosamine-1-phosphate transferase